MRCGVDALGMECHGSSGSSGVVMMGFCGRVERLKGRLEL